MTPYIVPVRTEAEMTRFLEFPWALYGRETLWTPPIKKQERELLTPGQHPFWENASRDLFLALRDGVVVGRIAAILDRSYNAYAGQRCGAWGFFECRNDREAAHALFGAVRDRHAAAGMDYLRGPLNPSTNYTCGMLVDGFDEAPALMMPWNPPYYAELAESWRMRKEQDLFAYRFTRANLTLSETLEAELRMMRERGTFTCRPSSKTTLQKDIAVMLDLYQESWAENWGFTPMSPAEAARHVQELKDILDPNFFVLFFHEEEAVAGMLALPDMTPLLRRLNGALGISALWHWWRTRQAIRHGYRLLLFGVRKRYRLHGLPLLLLDYLFKQAAAHPEFQWLEGSWLLEDNTAINDMLEDCRGTITKRYRLYRKEISR